MLEILSNFIGSFITFVFFIIAIIILIFIDIRENKKDMEQNSSFFELNNIDD